MRNRGFWSFGIHRSDLSHGRGDREDDVERPGAHVFMNSYHGPFRSSRESQWMRALHLNLSQDCNLVLLPVFTTAHHGPFILLINPQWMRALHPNLSQDCNLVPLPVFMASTGIRSSALDSAVRGLRTFVPRLHHVLLLHLPGAVWHA